MSNRALTQAFQAPATIKGTARLVMLVLADSASSDTGHSFLGLRRIAAYAGVKTRAAQYALRTLESLGIITTSIQQGGLADWEDSSRPNLYVWQYDAMEALISAAEEDPDAAPEGTHVPGAPSCTPPVHHHAPGAPSCTPPGAPPCTPPGAPSCTPPVHHHAPNPSIEPPLSNPPRRSPNVVGRVLSQQRADARPTTTPKRGTRLPHDWQPSHQLHHWATTQRPDLDITAETDAFRDYWTAKTGSQATKLDWDATYRNWIRRARPTTRTTTPGENPFYALAAKYAQEGH